MPARTWTMIYSKLHVRRIGICIGMLLVIAGTAIAASSFTNYRATIKVNDIIEYNNKIWVASSGGLACIDPKTNTKTLITDIHQFPDLNLTGLCIDSSGNLWIASSQGYLCKQTPSGTYTVYNSYYASGWDILDISVHGQYLLVGSGSKNGFSIFDPAKGVALKNATSINTSSNNQSIYAIAVHNDSLYLGLEKGYAVLDISGNKLLNNNYYDKTIWRVVPSSEDIVAFADSNGIFKPCKTPAALYNNAFVATDTTMTVVSTADGTTLCTLPSAVRTMYTDNSGNLWLGTTENYLYKKNASGLVQDTLPGPTISDISRIWASRNGTLWLIPPMASSNVPWWQGIVSYDGKLWKLYNNTTAVNFGGNGSSDFHGIGETRDSTMWFGGFGLPIKRYIPGTDTWKRYYIDGYECCANEIRELPATDGGVYWGKHDAIAQDSSGFIWFGCYTNKYIVNSLVCYNPLLTTTPNSRRFFSTDDDRHIQNVRTICVDSKGIILVGSDDGRLLIFSHSGNPVQDSIARYYVDQRDLSNIKDISAAPNGISWIVTNKGLYSYTSGEDSLHFISDTATFSSVAVECDSVIWLGTTGSGLMRYSTVSGTLSTIETSEGLISNTINDLSIDRKNGYLWIATSDGLSRFTLGHSFTSITNNNSIVAYPNPYSLSNPNHREIVFKHCAVNARVTIYAMNGSLVKSLTPDANSAYTLSSNSYETTLSWTPPKNIAPGTYFFAGSKPYVTKKIIIIP